MAAVQSYIRINPAPNPAGGFDTPMADVIVTPDGSTPQRLGAVLAAGGGSGVTSAVAGSGVQVSGATGAVTFSSTEAAGAAQKSANLSDLANAGTARTNLGLGTAATQASGAFATAAQGATADLAVQPNTTPTLTGVNIGSTGTTLTELSAGQLGIEGNVVYRAGGTDVAVADGGTGSSTAATARAALGVATDAIEFVIDGGGSAITTGVKGDIQVPYACTITSATLLADQSGSIVVDVWKDTYANYPPVVGDKITASAPPTISSAVKSTDSTLTGWTLAITAGDTLRFNVNSATTITRVTLILGITK